MGILRKYGKIYDEENKEFLEVDPSKNVSNYGGFMNIYADGYAGARFGVNWRDLENRYVFFFNLSDSSSKTWYRDSEYVKSKPGWSGKDYPWNQNVPADINMNEDTYISLVFDGLNNKETVYINGEKKDSVEIGEEYWKSFLSNMDKYHWDKICVGRGNMDGNRKMHYTEMNCYTMRIYSKTLSDDEIKENYKMSVAYHNFLENDGNSK